MQWAKKTGTGTALPGYMCMSNDQKDLAQNPGLKSASNPMTGVMKKDSRPAARLLRCEVCGQVFDARDVGELVHHSLMGPGHKQLEH
jgi:hypothetical protein